LGEFVQDRTIWLKLIGLAWLAGGLIGLLWGTFALISSPDHVLLTFRLSPSEQAFSRALWISPWAEIAAILHGAFAGVVGWELIRRRGWVQTVIVPAHMLFAVYALSGWIAVQPLRRQPEMWWPAAAVVLLAIALFNVGGAILMSSPRVKEALSWLPMQTSLAVSLRCEFCGSELDPETSLCPQCDAVPEIAGQPIADVEPRAKLISLTDNAEFWVEPDSLTRIGRGLAANDIDLSNPTVSHAQIEPREGHFVLTALRDLNGTFVNDTLIRQRTLRDGDEVRFGRARFQFVVVRDQRG
jgi:hypothetical protein